MNKCENCGTEFEGKFCPECGRRATDGGACPNCGAPRKGGEKFCSECGYSFADGTPSAAEKTKTASPAVKKLYSAMRGLPSVLALVFASVCLLFFIASAGSSSVMGVTEEIGSVYSVAFDDFGDYANLASTFKALVVTDIILWVFALISIVFSYKRELKALQIKAGKFVCVATNIFTAVAGAFLFVIFIISCVACGQLAGEAAGLELFAKVSPGAGLVLTLTFSIVFCIAAALCPIGRFILGKRNPAWKEEEKRYLDDLRATVKAEKTCRDLSTAAGQTGTVRDIKCLNRRRFAMLWLPLVPVVLGVMSIWPVTLIIYFRKIHKGKGKNKLADWEPSVLNSKRLAYKRCAVAMAVLSAILAIVDIILICLTGNAIILSRLETCAMLCCMLLLTFYIVLNFFLSLNTLKLIGRLERTFYGEIKPAAEATASACDMAACVTVYTAAKKGRDKAAKPRADGNVALYALLTVALTAVMVITVVFSTVDMIFSSSAWAEKYVAREGVVYYNDPWAIFGHDYIGYHNRSEYEEYLDYRYEYYTHAYGELYERKLKLQKDLEHASDNNMQSIQNALAGVEAKLAGMEYRCILVGYMEVVFNASGGKSGFSYKVKKVRLSDNTLNASGGALTEAEAKTLTAEVWYNDGSYHWWRIGEAATLSGVSGTTGTLRWNDEYFNVTVETKVTVNQSA